MSQAYTGGCACGAIRYRIPGEPIFQNHCQCLDCQHKSGTGHGSYLTFPRAGVEQTGEATLWDIVGDSGHVKTRAFCPACGSPVYMTFSAMPAIYTVHAASLLTPLVASVLTRSGHLAHPMSSVATAGTLSPS